MFETNELTVAEHAIIAAEGLGMAVSVVLLWELRIKWHRRFTSGARKGPADPAAMLAALDEARIEVLGLDPDACIATLAPPLEHFDPFDELLLKQGAYRLLTRDRKLAGHPVTLLA